MTTIEKHLEKAKFWNDTERVDQLEKVLSRGTLTFKEWVKSAIFVPVEEEKDYAQLIEYIGDVSIQVLSTGEFQYKETKSTDLDTIEMILWIDIAEKLWCETC
jgi:hypothetical protein